MKVLVPPGLIKLVAIKDHENATKGLFTANHRMFTATFYPKFKLFFTDNVRAFVTNSMPDFHGPSVLAVNPYYESLGQNELPQPPPLPPPNLLNKHEL